MPQIKQDDLLTSNISITRGFNNLFNLSVTTGTTIPANNINAAQGTLCAENKSVSGSYPLWIKTNGFSSIGWTRESDWQIHNQTITNNTILFYNAGANTSVTPTSQNITISVSTPIAIYGPGAWTLVSNLAVSVFSQASFGTYNNSMVANGARGAAQVVSNSQFFNGSSWIIANSTNIAKQQTSGAGTTQAGLIFCGIDGSSADLTITELFNGSTWTLSSNTGSS